MLGRKGAGGLEHAEPGLPALAHQVDEDGSRQLADLRHEPVVQADQVARGREELPTLRRQADVACRPDEQLHPQARLELADLPRQGLLATNRRVAARVKCSSSATATKYRSERMSRSASGFVAEFTLQGC